MLLKRKRNKIFIQVVSWILFVKPVRAKIKELK